MKKSNSHGRLLLFLIAYILLFFFMAVPDGNGQTLSAYSYPSSGYSYPSTGYPYSALDAAAAAYSGYPFSTGYVDPYAYAYNQTAIPYGSAYLPGYSGFNYNVPAYTTPSSTSIYVITSSPDPYQNPLSFYTSGYPAINRVPAAYYSTLTSPYPYPYNLLSYTQPQTTPYTPITGYQPTQNPLNYSGYSPLTGYYTNPQYTTPQYTTPQYTTPQYTTPTPYPATTTTTLSGNWSGSWLSNNGSHGGASLSLTQNSSNLTGNVSFTDQYNQPKLSAGVSGVINGSTLQLWATINGGTEIYNLTIIGTITGTTLSGNYRVASSSAELESGTVTIVKQY